MGKIKDKMNQKESLIAVISCGCDYRQEIVLMSNSDSTAWDKYGELREETISKKCGDCGEYQKINWAE